MKELLAYFDRELPGVNSALEAECDGLNGLVRDVAKHSVLSGGKRIRPMLVILTARCLGHAGDGLVPLACALEMLHSATLLHDDILDGAELRRNRKAAHLVFGTTETILAGDVLLALSNQLGARYDKPRVSWLLAQGIMHTAEGEIMEIEALSDPEMDRGRYMDIIIGKTARLIETACRCGAAVAGVDRSVEDTAGDYGLNLGIAFQLVDDALDYVSPSEVMGKPEGGDLKEGKVTLPLLLLLEDMGRTEAEALLARLRQRRLTPEEQADVVRQVVEGGHAEATRQVAADYVAQARAALDALPDTPERLVLDQAADYVLNRKK